MAGARSPPSARLNPDRPGWGAVSRWRTEATRHELPHNPQSALLVGLVAYAQRHQLAGLVLQYDPALAAWMAAEGWPAPAGGLAIEPDTLARIRELTGISRDVLIEVDAAEAGDPPGA